MTTWVDPTFGEAALSAGLIAIGRVVDSDPRGGRVVLERIFAGDRWVGETVDVRRSPVVGRGHEGWTLPRGQALAFVLRAAGGGAYEAFTDSYWSFPISDGAYVHMPFRDPFTRAYVPFDDLAELVRLLRDRQQSPVAFLARLCGRLTQTPVAATQPIQVNEQILALESLAHLGSPAYTDAATPYLRSPHYQIRWSAVRAVATCRGPAAARALLDRLAREDAPPVQAALAEALSNLADASMRDALQAALPRMYGSSMPYSQNVMSPIMNAMPCPRDALAATIAKLSVAPAAAGPAVEAGVPPAARLRAMASARKLLALCESTPEGAVPLIDNGELKVLTTKENLAALETACEKLFGAHKLTLQPIEDGVGIFANVPPPVTRIRVDPGTPAEQTFSGAGLGALRDMARSVAVTRLVENPGAHDPATFRRVMLAHQKFVVPLQPMAVIGPGPNVTSLTTEIRDGRVVPYEILRHQRADGTHYAVVFTWEDCAEAFFAALEDRMRTVTIDGETLFKELRRSEEVYGATSVVFDMEGPTKQSWLKIGSWRLVLG